MPGPRNYIDFTKIICMQFLKNSLLKKILPGVAAFLATIALALLAFFLIVYFGAFGHLPDKKELSAINNEEASLVFSADSVLTGEFFAENRTNIHWKDVPDHLVKALIATEDKRFFTHPGYDTRSYFRVFLKSILLGDNSGGGGSTLTQQLLKNLYGRNDYGLISMPVNKIKEIILAARIENVYSKQEIILLYLNSVPFGDEVYGVETASHRYFNKPTRDLSVQESAVLVGLLKANTHFNPRLNPANSLARRNTVLSLMEKEHYLTAKAADSLRKLPVILSYENLSLNAPAGYFVHQVRKKTLELLEDLKSSTGREYNLEKDGLKIYTTLDYKVQEMATKAVKNQLQSMQQLLDRELESRSFKKQWVAGQKQLSKDPGSDKVKKDVDLFGWDGMETKHISRTDSLWYYYKMLNAAVLITNPKTGAVIAWIGGNHFNTLPFDMVMSHRQIASAFKPFLYATALEGEFTPCTYLANEEKKYPGYEDWEPQNADKESTPGSTVALWYALSHSMNLPTIDLYFRTGRENLVNTCNKLEFPKLIGDAPSVALGTLDLSLYEIVRAYAAFADQGKLNELFMINKITDASGKVLYLNKAAEPKTVFRAETSQVITAILQEAVNQGTGTRIRSTYGIRAELAGKTGTAQNCSDAWFIAYTPDLVVGTWVGASSPQLHFNGASGSGAALALPVVAGILRDIENDKELNGKYLTPFRFQQEAYSFRECEPYRQIGIKGFFNRLFKGKNNTDKDNRDPAPKNNDKRDKKAGVKRR